MKLVLFVHECDYETGHSHAMLETFKNFPSEKIDEIRIVSFVADPPEKIFPQAPEKVKFVKVPFPFLYPFIIKVVFYHIWTMVYNFLFLDKSFTRYSIGVASLCADVINVQFVHRQWASFFFTYKKMGPVNLIYQKILFTYLNWCEKYLYGKKGIQLFCLSKFVRQYIVNQYKVSEENCHVAYSGVNLEKYAPTFKSKAEIVAELKGDHPELLDLDLSRPIYLFVGAYERKGLQKCLDLLREKEEYQFLVVGAPESVDNITFPPSDDRRKIIKIRHSKKLPLIYELGDTFLFPTIYEPFGLVLIEAVAMGLEVYMTSNNVGASEILEGFEDVHLFSTPSDMNLGSPYVITPELRRDLISKRLGKLKSLNWEGTAKSYLNVLNN